MIATPAARLLTADGFASAERTRIFALTIIASLVSVFYGLLVVQMEVLSIAVLVHWTILTATIWRPRYGLYAIFFLMVLFEPGGADPLMGFGGYLHGGLTSTFNLSFLATTPVEMLLIFTGASWLAHEALIIIGTCLFTLLASERRAGFIALALSFVAFSAVLASTNRRAFMLLTVPIALSAAVYLPIFWNASGMIGQPARAVRSIVSPDARDAASNGYRDMEKINVRATLQSNPLMGVGFGKEFLFVVPLPDLSWWPFWHYEPHHNVMWVWLKTGAHGFIIFLTLMGIAVARATNLARRVTSPECRIFAIVTLTGILSTLIFSYVDLGLVVGRVTIWLGIALGVLGVLERIDSSTEVVSGGARAVSR